MGEEKEEWDGPWKEALDNLMRRDILAADFRRWYRLIDWIMKLPDEVNRAVWLRLEAIKEVQTVSHITFAKIIGREKGIQEGRGRACETCCARWLLA